MDDSLFISYNHKSKAIVSSIVDELRADNDINKNVIWIDKDQIYVGDQLTLELQTGIRNSQLILYFITKEYINSDKCRLEFFHAHELKKKGVYIMLEKINKEELNGMNLYLFGEHIRLNAYKTVENAELDDAAKARIIYQELKQSLTGKPAKKNATKQENVKPKLSKSSLLIGIFTITIVIIAIVMALIKLKRQKNVIVINDEVDLIELERNPDFIADEEVMGYINRTLLERRFAVLTGIGGIGKTSYALEFAYREAKNKKIYWFYANSLEKLQNRFIQLARKHYYDMNPNSKNEIDIQIAKKCFNNYLKASKESVILIFDGVKNLSHVKDVINFQKFDLMSIITKIQYTETDIESIQIPAFNFTNSYIYLNRVLPTLSIKDIERLIHTLENCSSLLPYRVTQVAGYLKHNPMVSIDTLIETIKKNADSFTIELFRRVEQQSQFACKLLYYSKHLDPDYIAYDILKEIVLAENELKNAIKLLYEQNICTYIHVNTPKFGIRIHRLIKWDIAKYNSTKHNETLIKIELLRIVNKLFPVFNRNPDYDWQKAESLYNHVLRLERYSEFNQTETEELIAKLGIYYCFKLCNYKKCLDYKFKLLEIRKEKYNHKDDDDIADAYNRIAFAYYYLGQYEKQLNYTLNALEISKRIHQSDHELTAKYLHNAGSSYFALQQNETALSYQLQSLEMRRRLFNGDHADIAQSLHGVFACNYNLNRKDQLLNYSLEGLEMRKKLFKGDHVDISMSLHGVGYSYFALNDNKTALNYHLQALEMRKRLFNSDNPHIAQSLDDLSLTYDALGEHEIALKHANECLEMRKRLFDDDHPLVIDSKKSISNIKNKIDESNQEQK